MQWMRDHNHLIEILSAELRRLIPDLVVIEEVADKLTFPHSDGEYYLSECEILLDMGDRVIAVTFLDNCSKLTQLIRDRNNPNDRLIYSQPDNLWPEIAEKSIRGVYTSQYPFLDLEGFYQLRNARTSFIDRLFFRGNYTGAGRGSVPILMQPEYNDVFAGGGGVDTHPYFFEAIQYKAGLSIPGVGELCYRDFEYMRIGLPMLRFDYEIPLNPWFLPNQHYISIPRLPDMTWVQEREGGQRMVDAYIQRFNEVKDDTEFLAMISRNAKEYYETYYSMRVRVPRMLTLMGL